MFQLRSVTRSYDGTSVVRVDDWHAAQGEHWLLAGPSGSGKSTLLNMLAGLLRASSGAIVVAGLDLAQARGAVLDRWRGRAIGLVPQRLHLVRSLSVLENLLLAQYVAGARQDRARAEAVLDAVDMTSFARRSPETLSQGQAQRVAIARAVVNRPLLLLADEPTASLDDAHAAQAMALLVAQARAVGATLVVASHDARAQSALAQRYDLAAHAPASVAA